MPTTIYIAELAEADYPRFRHQDPMLPETYDDWLKMTAERVRIRRRRGENVVAYQIHFDAFIDRNKKLRIPDFDEAARDHYAAEQAQAEGLSSWM